MNSVNQSYGEILEDLKELLNSPLSVPNLLETSGGLNDRLAEIERRLDSVEGFVESFNRTFGPERGD